MSYCRWGEADIYVYPADAGYECCACFASKDAAVFVAHIQEHIDGGASVPEWVIPDILRDDAEDRWGYRMTQHPARQVIFDRRKDKDVPQ